MGVQEGMCIELHQEARYAVVANAIPKAGTHLLRAMLTYLNVWRVVGHLYDETGSEDAALSVYPPGWAGTTHRLPAAEALTLLRPGDCLTAHAVHTPAMDAALASTDRLRAVVMLRDPRACLVSLVRYMTTSRAYARDAGHAQQQRYLLDTFDNFGDRLSHVLQTTDLGVYARYNGWRSAPHTLVLRFEDLSAEVAAVATDRDTPAPLTTALLEHVGVDPACYPTGIMLPQLWQRSDTASGRRGDPLELWDARHQEIYQQRSSAMPHLFAG